VPSWVNYLVYAKEYGIPPHEVESTPAIWYMRWEKYMKALEARGVWTQWRTGKFDFNRMTDSQREAWYWSQITSKVEQENATKSDPEN